MDDNPSADEMRQVSRKVDSMETEAFANYVSPSIQERERSGFTGSNSSFYHKQDAKHRCRLTIISQLSPREAHIYQHNLYRLAVQSEAVYNRRAAKVTTTAHDDQGKGGGGRAASV